MIVVKSFSRNFLAAIGDFLKRFLCLETIPVGLINNHLWIFREYFQVAIIGIKDFSEGLSEQQLCISRTFQKATDDFLKTIF